MEIEERITRLAALGEEGKKLAQYKELDDTLDVLLEVYGTELVLERIRASNIRYAQSVFDTMLLKGIVSESASILDKVVASTNTKENQ